MGDYRILTNARLFDGISAEVMAGASVAIEDGIIRDVSAQPIRTAKAEVVDLGDRFLMPGLIDCHFHAYAPTLDMNRLDRMPKPLLVSHAIAHLEGTLQRGFTTVRDPGGGDVGLCLAIEEGLVDGPRFYYGGKALSQTGGHGDMRPAHVVEPCRCAYSGVLCHVADGVDEVRRFCREELRKGAHHIKVMISGGIASPTDPIWMAQYTDEEIQAAVHEAQTRRKYVAAHCHTDDGAKRCLKNGVRSIEHGTMIRKATAEAIAASDDTFVVPTFSIMHQLVANGAAMGLSPDSIEKTAGVIELAEEALGHCARAGVKLGLGTDLFGADFQPFQSRELEYRCTVQEPIDVLRSATSINAEILQQEGKLGVIAPGARADLVAWKGDPVSDISVMSDPEAHLDLIMKGGAFKRRRV
ncbi:MAG: amidohydrolase family protein [Xanthomonadales bacterium]|nr:amidohydrolase family protein [Xanthomonadales bacterium]